MKLFEVLDALQEGKKIHRKIWEKVSNPTMYLELNKEDNRVYCHYYDKWWLEDYKKDYSERMAYYDFSYFELIADDWEIIED